MAELKEFELGAAGIDYIEKWLNGEPRPVLLSVRLPIRNGRAFTPLPADTTPAQVRNIEDGGLPEGPGRKSWLAAHVLSLFEKVPDGTFIIQDVWGARPTDPGVSLAVSRMLFSANVVYYVVTLEDASRQAIIEALRDPGSFLLSPPSAASTSAPEIEGAGDRRQSCSSSKLRKRRSKSM